MTLDEALDRLLQSYTRYYDVITDDTAPFSARAEFHSHGESYLLVKSARLWEMDSHEYVYFCAGETFSADLVRARIEAAWEDTMPRVNATESHRNSDVTVLFLADTLSSDARRALKHTARSKGYSHGLRGWSNLKLGAIELSTGRIACNRHGRDLKTLLRKIFSGKC